MEDSDCPYAATYELSTRALMVASSETIYCGKMVRICIWYIVYSRHLPISFDGSTSCDQIHLIARCLSAVVVRVRYLNGLSISRRRGRSRSADGNSLRGWGHPKRGMMLLTRSVGSRISPGRSI